MKIRKVNISQIRESVNLSAQYQISIGAAIRNYQSLLNRKFKKNKKLTFSELTEELTVDNAIKDDILIMNHLGGKQIIEIVSEVKKIKSIYNAYRIVDKRISSQYLLWFLSKKEIKDYLLVNTTGGVIRRFPIKVFEELLIPLPTIINKKNTRNRLVLQKDDNLIRRIIRNFYQDYQDNLDNKSFDTAIILAGAICEAILYESLIELGVPENILSRNKTLGTLIEFAQIKELDKTYGVSLAHFENIKQHRNKAIHIGSAIKRLEKGEIINLEVFKDFDNIIKNFGL